MHKGEIIQKAVKESGMQITQLARKLDVTRGTVYNIFSKYNVDNETILKIGELIHFDFSTKISQLKKSNVLEDVPQEYSTKVIVDLKEEVSYWKDKYITLLEEHTKLLKK